MAKKGTEKFRRDCRFFKGFVPCHFHKIDARDCKGCRDYQPVRFKILMIKLGAIGDVIRTTPLLKKLKEVYPDSEITWITYYPEVLPAEVDIKMKYDVASVVVATATRYNMVINLDKDYEACALTNLVSAKIKKGFYLQDGKTAPLNNKALHKYYTGLDDKLNKENKKSYVEEIFEICGYKFKNEPYILDKPVFDSEFLNIKNSKSIKRIIGLNTGCGARWLATRLWPDKYWIKLAKLFLKKGMQVILLGGENEDEKNRNIQLRTGADYFGFFPINKFIQLVDSCDLIVTQVTMCFHIAMGLGKNVVLLNNIFNRNEFFLYGLGTIIEPKVECVGCFRAECKIKCMELITPEQVSSEVIKILKRR